ncbi:MAG: O-methyltransferase [Acidobacteriota bacterium]
MTETRNAPFWKHPSFAALLQANPGLTALERWLPETCCPDIFSGQSFIAGLPSSYRLHGYDYFFYALTRALRPARCVEIGVLQGFSLLAVASALRDNGAGQVEGFDLFEDYAFKKEHYQATAQRLQAAGLETWARIERQDAFAVADRYSQIDLLHVDISNHGDTYRTLFAQWSDKVRQAIVFEGGSAERDQVDWMQKFSKSPIRKAIQEIRAGYPAWNICVLEPFPSVTVAVRAGTTICSEEK